MQTPLLTIVIPTFCRPALLPRAVESCLSGVQPGEVEVVVVPNGPDTSWRESLRRFEGDARVRVDPIEASHPSLARNHGMAAAQGMYIRFLDDDDYVLPDSARRQLLYATSRNLDACSGSLDIVDDHGRNFGRLDSADPTDFASAMLMPGRLTIPLAHLFRRSWVQQVPWRSDLAYLEDVDWLLRLVQHSPHARWAQFPEIVGVWFQHSGPRESPGLTTNLSQELLASWVQETIDVLDEQGSLTEGRKLAAAYALWQCAHRAFQFAPFFWNKIAVHAIGLSSHASPSIKLFGRNVEAGRFTLLLEWLVVVPRLVSHGLRRSYYRLAGVPYRRQVR